MHLLLYTQKVDKNDQILGFFHAWILEMAKHVELLTVVCLEEGEHDLPDNVRVWSLGKDEGKGRLVRVWRFYRYLFALRSSYHSVLVHMNPEYVVLGGLWWRLLRKKTVLWYTHKQVDTKLRMAEKLVSAIATASEKSFRLPSQKVHVLGHGIDTTHFTPSNKKKVSDTFSVLTVGRLSETKGVCELVEAVALLSSDSTCHLRIVGGPVTEADKVYERKVREYVISHNLTEVVEFVGPVAHSDLPHHYQDADVFVNLSNTGSLDKAILEAMSCGLPVVTSNEALQGVLPESLCTHLVEDRLPATIAAMLKKTSALSETERTSYARAAREYVEMQHSLPQLIGKLAALLT